VTGDCDRGGPAGCNRRSGGSCGSGSVWHDASIDDEIAPARDERRIGELGAEGDAGAPPSSARGGDRPDRSSPAVVIIPLPAPRTGGVRRRPGPFAARRVSVTVRQKNNTIRTSHPYRVRSIDRRGDWPVKFCFFTHIRFRRFGFKTKSIARVGSPRPRPSSRLPHAPYPNTWRILPKICSFHPASVVSITLSFPNASVSGTFVCTKSTKQFPGSGSLRAVPYKNSSPVS